MHFILVFEMRYKCKNEKLQVYQPKGIAVVMKLRSASFSGFLGPASEAAARAVELVEAAATGGATGFGLAEMPILPVKESNNPPTEGPAFTTTSGSWKSDVIISPRIWATINALYKKKNKNKL